jgi:intein/homing endonuclease
LKFKEKKPWQEIAYKLGISRAMLFNYKSGHYPIYKEVFNKMQIIANYKPNFRIINNQKYVEKSIRRPALTEVLAEILGALSGDGHVSGDTYEVSITCSRQRDRAYIFYLKVLCQKLFNIEFKILVQEGKIRLKTYSKNLALFLHNEYGLPLGEKKGSLRVPVKLKTKPELLRSYIRGLFDTDGSIYLRRKKDLVVDITSADPRFLTDVKIVFDSLGFKANLGKRRVCLYRQDMVEKFFKEIKPANKKHLKRYKIYSSLRR